MLFLSKKRLLFVFNTVCLSLVIPIALLTYEKPSIETVALPTTNRTIILDAGHGKPDDRCI